MEQLMLVNTENFSDNIKRDTTRLFAYVMDYADYSAIALEASGLFRCFKTSSCILGREDPRGFRVLLWQTNLTTIYHCNLKCFGVVPEAIRYIDNHIDDYAIVSCDCFCNTISYGLHNRRLL